MSISLYCVFVDVHETSNAVSELDVKLQKTHDPVANCIIC